MTNTWREKLKSGPLSGLYLLARNTKRRLRQEPLAGTLALPQTSLSAEELRALAPTMPDQARLYYSLGLAYLLPHASLTVDDIGDPLIAITPVEASAHRKALACLRCAEALDFESAERVALYKAWIYLRLGNAAKAQRMIEALDKREFTEAEARLLSRVNSPPPLPLRDAEPEQPAEWLVARQIVQESGGASVVVIGDSMAFSAEWLPDSRYMLADAAVTGVSAEVVARLGWQFSIAVGSNSDRIRAEESELQFDQWIIL
jgi:hypothetical protein